MTAYREGDLAFQNTETSQVNVARMLVPKLAKNGFYSLLLGI
jgi:hypothetical protein